MADSKSLMDALDTLHCGGVLLNKQGRVIECNRTARQVLRPALKTPARSEADVDWIASALERLSFRASRKAWTDGHSWSMTHRRATQPLAVHSIPLAPPEEGSALVIVDLNLACDASPAVLQKLFALTPAEADLAVKIGRGETLAAIARRNGTTIATVRSQLAAVFAKTYTQRQAELVALLARVSLLPEP